MRDIVLLLFYYIRAVYILYIPIVQRVPAIRSDEV
jgi:hypothetical protein